MWKADLRKEKILLLLADKKRMRVSEVCAILGVSPATARRLCNELAEEGKVLRSHGAIQRIDEPNEQYDLNRAMTDGYWEKRRIGRYAAGLLKDGDYIFLESGSTILGCALAIAEQIKGGKLKDLHVFTDFLVVPEVLGTLCEVSLIGGVYRPAKKSVYGYLSRRSLKKMSFEYCFISCEGISLDDGLMTYDEDAISYAETLFSYSQSVVVMAHSKKFLQRAGVSYMPCHRAKMIITDEGLPEKEAALFLQQGINLVRV